MDGTLERTENMTKNALGNENEGVEKIEEVLGQRSNNEELGENLKDTGENEGNEKLKMEKRQEGNEFAPKNNETTDSSLEEDHGQTLKQEQEKLRKLVITCKANPSFSCVYAKPWWLISSRDSAEITTAINTTNTNSLIFSSGSFVKISSKIYLIITMRYFFDGKRDRLKACCVPSIRSLAKPTLHELGSLQKYNKQPESITEEHKRQVLANLETEEDEGTKNTRKRKDYVQPEPMKKAKQTTSNTPEPASVSSLVPTDLQGEIDSLKQLIQKQQIEQLKQQLN
jgi:hypothetical protein